MNKQTEELLDHFYELVKYWAWAKDEYDHSVQSAMEGLVHSILVTIDGCSMDVEGLELVRDKKVINDNEEYLHDLWNFMRRERSEKE